MSQEHLRGLDPNGVGAIQELEGIVTERFPRTTFEVGRSADDPDIVLLWASVDVEDPDEVTELVLDRMIEMQVEESIPVYLVPIRTPERILAELRAETRPERTARRIVSALHRAEPSSSHKLEGGGPA